MTDLLEEVLVPYGERLGSEARPAEGQRKEDVARLHPRQDESHG